MDDAPEAPTPVGSNLLRPRRRSAARRWLITLSMIVHGGAIAAYVVVGMLRVEKLKPERGRITVALGMQLPDSSGGPEPGSKPKDPPKPKREEPRIKPKIQVDDTVQPTTDTSKISNTGETRSSTSEIPGTGSGQTPGAGSGSNRPPGGGGCVGEDCPPPRSEPVEDDKPEVVELPPQDMAQLNMTPDHRRKIQPSDVTKTTMVRDGKAKTLGIIRVCIDEHGKVTRASLTKSTGYPEYDATLIRGVRDWAYRPATKAGKALAACSNVFFNFVLK